MSAPAKLTPAREALPAVLPVIGLWQPYASLIAVGVKPEETRHFPAPPRLLGKRVAIQATLRKPTRDEVDWLDDECQEAFGFCHWASRIPYGAIVCTAVLTASRRVLGNDNGLLWLSDGTTMAEDRFGDYEPGRYCWRMTKVVPLREPIPLKGRQEVGWLWTPDDVQRAALAAQERADVE